MKQKKQLIRREDVLGFLGLTAFLIVSQVLSEDCTTVLEALLKWLEVPLRSWGVPLSFMGLCGAVFGGYLLARSNPRPSAALQALIGLMAFIALVLSSALPGWGVQALGFADLATAFRIVQCAILLVIWGVLWYAMLPLVQYWFQTPVDLATNKSPTVPEGPVTLIALVSRIKPQDFSLEVSCSSATLRTGGGDNPTIHTLAFRSLSQDIDNLRESKWSWQQLLRAVNRYAPRKGLKVVLVGSHTSDENNCGSYEQLEQLCKPFLERYPELLGATVTIFPHALDFDDFNDVKDKIRRCIRQECRAVGETNVFVDVTGGQKVASAAATAATVGTNGQFQYVRTNPPYDVMVSDLHPQVVPTPGS